MKAPLLFAALLLATGCSGGREENPSVIGRLAAATENAPDEEAQRLLAAAGHDEASFRRSLERISEDPDKAAEFDAAYRAATPPQ